MINSIHLDELETVQRYHPQRRVKIGISTKVNIAVVGLGEQEGTVECRINRVWMAGQARGLEESQDVHKVCTDYMMAASSRAVSLEPGMHRYKVVLELIELLCGWGCDKIHLRHDFRLCSPFSLRVLPASWVLKCLVILTYYRLQ